MPPLIIVFDAFLFAGAAGLAVHAIADTVLPALDKVTAALFGRAR